MNMDLWVWSDTRVSNHSIINFLINLIYVLGMARLSVWYVFLMIVYSVDENDVQVGISVNLRDRKI